MVLQITITEINNIKNFIFLISSGLLQKSYNINYLQVELSLPLCECVDCMYRIPCKHIFAVIGDDGWTRLPTEYLKCSEFKFDMVRL